MRDFFDRTCRLVIFWFHLSDHLRIHFGHGSPDLYLFPLPFFHISGRLQRNFAIHRRKSGDNSLKDCHPPILYSDLPLTQFQTPNPFRHIGILPRHFSCFFQVVRDIDHHATGSVTKGPFGKNLPLLLQSGQIL